ncbi:hypothetical protein EBA31_21885 [Serratia sp. P2ACOL2]|nr:hypothetical protein EBA31_21885 [Serratia sp. P2ACOL2]
MIVNFVNCSCAKKTIFFKRDVLFFLFFQVSILLMSIFRSASIRFMYLYAKVSQGGINNSVLHSLILVLVVKISALPIITVYERNIESALLRRRMS